ncbi:hypothetical protein [Ruegeria sp. HKCCD6119]|uniref:hypothetical protein n=1 Tax=Ruegeria sp. HKCCD6119 TaxID=2683003 RepID=UPI0014922D02|nr:hypothetical protein [Ruegeria sp. HKCCD6119]NOD85859.1 hypothetical protein [Ruegeria sp. HKCCD6119]
MQFAFVADDSDELLQKLETWGAFAPPRLERRGRQKELERFCLRLLLLHQCQNGLLSFPVKVEESENPDFVLTSDGSSTGIEVVEASDPREQAEWTAHEKRGLGFGEPIVREIDLMDPDRMAKFGALVEKAILSKAKKCSSGVDELLIYANTDWDDFEDLEWKTSALSGCNQIGRRFSKIWILSGGDVFTVSS